MATRNYILTGSPGAGKTTIIQRLSELGHIVVEESFMDVYRSLRAQRHADPLADESFVDRVVRAQAERERVARARAVPRRYFDRSPLCTLALSNFMGRPPSEALLQEVERMRTQAIYAPTVYFIRNLGYVPGNEVGKMQYEDALAFEEVHRSIYSAHGYVCIEIPALPVDARVRLILEHNCHGRREA